MSMSPKIKQIMNILNVKSQQPVIVDVSPIIAKELLRFNTNNRRVSETIVNKYAKRMINNQWRNSNDAISFSETGEISNGQHRLRAIIKSGKTVNLLVAFNTNNFPDMDRGRNRTISDNIQTDSRFRGTDIANNKAVHQVANSLVRILKGKTETEDVAFVLQKYGDDLLYLEQSGLFSGPKGFNAKSISAALFVAYENNIDLAKLNHIRDISNTGVTEYIEDAPIIGLRDKVMQIQGGGTPVEQVRYKLTCYTIQAIEKGSTSKRCSLAEPKYTIDIEA